MGVYVEKLFVTTFVGFFWPAPRKALEVVFPFSPRKGDDGFLFSKE